MIANELSLSMDGAFGLLRTYARDRNLTIRVVAEQVSNREVGERDIASVARR